MAYENEIEQEITGSSYEECRNKLFKLYGKDYHIVNKFIDFRPGGLFYLKKKPVTVVKYVVNHQKSYNPDSSYAYADESEARIQEEEALEMSRKAILESLQVQTPSNSQLGDIKDSIEKLNTEMKKLAGAASANQQKHDTVVKIDEMLEKNEFSFSFISMIEEKIRKEFSLEQLDDFDLVQRRVIDWIGESIHIARQMTYRPPHVYILVGPTGVGKTTTLVKLAAQFVKGYAQNNNGTKPNICFITTDTMRVGAMEQLERWGKHMGSPVYKAERAEDLKELYNQNKDNVDAIFIDTSGFSPNDASHIGQMKMTLDIPGMNSDIYLTMMASTKANDLKNIMQNYEHFGYNSVIITKCDESEQFGNIISALYEKNKAIAYITNGQVASKDIARADVIEFLKRLEDFKIDRVHIEDKFGE